jgi:hypothetical protein
VAVDTADIIILCVAVGGGGEGGIVFPSIIFTSGQKQSDVLGYTLAYSMEKLSKGGR